MGLAATLIIGVGVFSAFIVGSVLQYNITTEGLLVAIVLGVLTATCSAVKDYKDIEGDREAGVKTLPIIYGYDRSINMNMLAVGLSYCLSLVPYMLGYFNPVSLPLVLIIAIVNLKLLRDLKYRKDLASRRKVYIYCLSCFFGVVLVYVLAKFL